MKRDYYELLEVSSTASEAEIRKAYRKNALKYHPDKHPGEEDQYNEIFAEYTAAYEVLMDPQERAWYDQHKNHILSEGNYEPEVYETGVTVHDLVQFFDPQLYRRYDDTVAGFYQVVARVFETIRSDEVDLGQDIGDFPDFGASDSNYDVVRLFYAHWSGFSTKKAFEYRDEYKHVSGMDRRTRRAVEKTNKKVRDAAKKEYNETVRQYVAFVKKRDPRVKRGVEELERLRKAKIREEKEKREAELAKRRKEKVGFQLQEWQKMDSSLEEAFEGVSLEPTPQEAKQNDDESEDEDSEELLYECVVCDKVFKSENQLNAHEKSKKHKKEAQRLVREMRREGLELGLD